MCQGIAMEHIPITEILHASLGRTGYAFQHHTGTEPYVEPCYTSKMERFLKKVNG